MKVREILKLSSEELEKMMTEEEFERMQELGIEYVWELLDAMQDGARQSGLENEEEYITISAYLDYLEEI